MKLTVSPAVCLALSSVFSSVGAFTTTPSSCRNSVSTSKTTDKTTELYGFFDGFKAQGSGKDRLDEEWEAQQEILRLRNGSQQERDNYFAQVSKRRIEADKEQKKNWAWQTKQYAKGEDPINEWRKRRAEGTISDLDNQYGDPKEIGGIPIPGASFGVGGEFGVGGKFDNGGRFDLRLPYADQGYVDEDADVMGKLTSFFTGGNKKKEETPPPPPVEEPKKGMKWPWEK
eukprot:CAMPEP_0178957672 /NCGR_PEP_ID=MMETSP0789-20121207/11073_1 /TAXON_ID=3005 /ORGANISM="Rhizosolenia setigera, Strain CCMP 1694" /LENGTH=228 /DNA_ID=CAMNT_0020640005 /DNA_START=35 /DNA_END=721 /DNA_ORIENTATION=+